MVRWATVIVKVFAMVNDPTNSAMAPNTSRIVSNTPITAPRSSSHLGADLGSGRHVVARELLGDQARECGLFDGGVAAYEQLQRSVGVTEAFTGLAVVEERERGGAEFGAAVEL